MSHKKLPDRLTALEERVARLPAWLQPAAAGAMLVFVIVGARMLFALPVLLIFVARDGIKVIALALGVLIAALVAGAAGGLAYSAVGDRLLRFGRIGAYVTGTICVAGYLVPLLLIMTFVDDRKRFDPTRPASWIIALVATMLFGTIFGHAAFVEDDPAAGRRPKRVWIQRKQRVTSRRPQN